MTESQNQDVDEADDNASDSASEDMKIEDVEEGNAETDLLEGEDLQPVNDSTKIIEDPANPACGMIVDYTLDGSLLEAYSKIHFSCNEGKVDDIWYKGSYDGDWYCFLYGKIDNRYEYITTNSASSFNVIREAKSYVGKYSSIRMVFLQMYYYGIVTKENLTFLPIVYWHRTVRRGPEKQLSNYKANKLRPVKYNRFPMQEEKGAVFQIQASGPHMKEMGSTL